MIANHAQFIDAIRNKNYIRIAFYSLPDNGTVNRECIPLDYGPEPGVEGAPNLYWIWDPASSTGSNPLGLSPGQIVNVQVFSRNFSPEQFPLGPRTWNIIRDWPAPHSTASNRS